MTAGKFPQTPGAPGWKEKPKGPAFAVAALIAGLIVALSPSEGGRRLKPYLDSIGIPTACIGVIGPEVTRRYKAGLLFTDAECQEMETAYLAKMIGTMGACIPDPIRREMTYGQWVSLGHWNYNTGSFCRSGVQRALVAGNFPASCRAMGQWTFVTYKGKKRNCRDADMRKICGGIVTRRDLEVNSCLEALP